VADLEQRGETSVDEVVCGISIVHNQYVPSRLTTRSG
jgi:ESCRT-I complex subunit TSG101